MKAATTVVRYQFRPLVATQLFSNNHLQIYNLLAFQNQGIALNTEEDEEILLSTNFAERKNKMNY